MNKGYIADFDYFSVTHPTEAQELIEVARHYSPESFGLFEADCGWMPWMEDFTDAEDGEPASEREAENIRSILQGAFRAAQGLDALETLTLQAGYCCGYDVYINSGDLLRGCSSTGRYYWLIPTVGLIFDDGELRLFS